MSQLQKRIAGEPRPIDWQEQAGRTSWDQGRALGLARGQWQRGEPESGRVDGEVVLFEEGPRIFFVEIGFGQVSVRPMPWGTLRGRALVRREGQPKPAKKLSRREPKPHQMRGRFQPTHSDAPCQCCHCGQRPTQKWSDFGLGVHWVAFHCLPNAPSTAAKVLESFTRLACHLSQCRRWSDNASLGAGRQHMNLVTPTSGRPSRGLLPTEHNA